MIILIPTQNPSKFVAHLSPRFTQSPPPTSSHQYLNPHQIIHCWLLMQWRHLRMLVIVIQFYFWGRQFIWSILLDMPTLLPLMIRRTNATTAAKKLYYHLKMHWDLATQRMIIQQRSMRLQLNAPLQKKQRGYTSKNHLVTEESKYLYMMSFKHTTF